MSQSILNTQQQQQEAKHLFMIAEKPSAEELIQTPRAIARRSSADRHSKHQPQANDQSAELPSNGFVSINVGGRVFHTTIETLRLIPPMPATLSNVIQAPALFRATSPPVSGTEKDRRFEDESQPSSFTSPTESSSSHKSPTAASNLQPQPVVPNQPQPPPPSFFSLLFTQGSNQNHDNLTNNSQGTLNSHMSQYTLTHHGGLTFYKNVVTRDSNGNLFLDRDPDIFEHVLTYLRTGQVFVSGDKNQTLVFLQRLKAEAEFFLLDHLVQIIDGIFETENSDKELLQLKTSQEDWMEYRVMTVSDVANSTFLSLLNSGKGWKIERMFTETKVVFKCPTCTLLYAGGSSNTSYFPNGAVIPCQCAIKHEKSAWVTEQIQRALLVRKKGVISQSQSGILRK
jgi:hypothetical protein